MAKLLIALIAIALLVPAHAATLKGTVFDAGFQPITALVKVNTTPEQRMVTQNGSFQFQVPRGFFKLTVSAGNSSVNETISIISEGTFNVDLILLDFDAPDIGFPNVTEESGFENGNPNGSPAPQTAQPPAGTGLEVPALVLLLLAGGILYFFYNRLRKTEEKVEHDSSHIKRVQEQAEEEDSELTQLQSEILKEIGKNEGRMNQKELRKLLPFSEAKVSIELDLLEEKGLVKKFKKGRGNVIVLTKK